ncbi:MAG: plasma-membrane proton-efflux P-type ATPase [Patescibacteria group bacterium]|nr:plasma-membrane proton-efflux P-type ATPase [Patescibacteria group bacterium]
MAEYHGLTQKEADEKLRSVGWNEIPEPRGVWLKKIFSWIFSFISLMLIAAAAISYFDGRIFDFYFISSLWVVNFFIGFWHEKKADDAIKKLQAKLSVVVNALRDGAWKEIPAREIVPGDVVSLGAGKIIPADVKFLETKNVSVNESALTGESLPKDKNPNDAAYSGSFLVTGLAVAEVAATGKATYFGKTLLAVEKSRKRSLLEDDIVSIARFLAVASIIAVIVLSAIFLYFHQPFFDLLTLDLSLVIAGIPVSLPTVMTLIISLGVVELVKKNVVVRRLSSLEDLSNVDLLLSDKTGTLTANQLSVSEIIPYNHCTVGQVLSFAFAASAKSERGPIEVAITKRFESETGCENYDVLDFTPADSERKRSTAVISVNGVPRTIALGAPQVVAKLSNVSEKDAENFSRDIKLAANGGYRVLAVASAEGKDEKNMSLIGTLLISDTPVADARDTIAFMGKNNIGVKILTGDNIAISERLAQEMGLSGNVIDRSALEKIGDSSFGDSVFEKTAVFSEILPADKYKLVEIGEQHHRIAVTGDGVNDIPAVKVADVGIAVANAVDALKSAADIVLLSAGISVIKDAIIEARKIFARLYTYALYRTSESLRLIISIALLGIIYLQYPIAPIQILILALLNDLPVISLAYDRVHIASKPAVVNARSRTLLGSLYGLTGVLGSVIFVVICRQVFHLDWSLIQTLFFLKLSISGHMLVYVAHTKERWWKFLPSGAVIWATSLTQLLATILAVSGTFMSPIGLSWAIAVWIWAFAWMQVSELVKWAMVK